MSQHDDMETKKIFDLDRRTFRFAVNVRGFIAMLHKSLLNLDDAKQLLRSSGSVGANYIEANEALSKKDFLMRIKICRKEAKESSYWLNLIYTTSDSKHEDLRTQLIQESIELTKIFGAIVTKSGG